jgi:hypothetical protein
MRKTLCLLAALAAALPAVLAPLPSAAATRPAAASPSVVVRDVTLSVHGTPVSLYIVAPAAHHAQSRAGILFLHWFAPGTVAPTAPSTSPTQSGWPSRGRCPSCRRARSPGWATRSAREPTPERSATS